MTLNYISTKKTFEKQLRKLLHYPANIYLFKVNNRNSRKRCDIRRSGVFIVKTLNIFYAFF